MAKRRNQSLLAGLGIFETSPEPCRTVRQVDLQRLRELARAEREYRALRQTIMDILKENSDVESGPLGVSFTEQHMRTISYERLVEAMGQQEADWIRDQIIPTVVRRFHIVDIRDHGRGAGDGGLP